MSVGEPEQRQPHQRGAIQLEAALPVLLQPRRKLRRLTTFQNKRHRRMHPL